MQLVCPKQLVNIRELVQNKAEKGKYTIHIVFTYFAMCNL